jgi:hypothetical protein
VSKKAWWFNVARLIVGLTIFVTAAAQADGPGVLIFDMNVSMIVSALGTLKVWHLMFMLLGWLLILSSHEAFKTHVEAIEESVAR